MPKSEPAAPQDAGRLARGEKLGLRQRDGQNLTTAVVATSAAGGVRDLGAATLAACAELSGVPAVGSLARAEAHLRSLAFWDTHGR